MVSYEVSLARVVDFSAGFDKGWEALWQEFYCDWRALRFDQGIEPPSWTLGDWVLNAGCAGLLFPSQANPGGINLVIYTEALGADDSINVYDPNGDLPTSQASWR